MKMSDDLDTAICFALAITVMKLKSRSGEGIVQLEVKVVKL